MAQPDKALTVTTQEDDHRHQPRASVRGSSRKLEDYDDEEPLIDTTVILPLHSKKLDRLNKRQVKKSQKLASQKALASILRLPPELLLQVIGSLQPIDVLRLQQVNHALQDFVSEHEQVIAKDIVQQRLWVLYRCFPLPVPLVNVDRAAHPALLNERRQKMMAIHKKAYQHVPVIDETEFCTCMTCVFAWNNLCVLLDFAHWQKNLDNREPIPMIQRGRRPEWNEKLLEVHATVVRKAVVSPLTHAVILEAHLRSINGTIMRRSRWTRKPAEIDKRAYHLSELEAASGSDEYLERSGPPCYEFPYHRDNYYSLEAYVPNRKWSKERRQWMYYAHLGSQHERDVEWTMTHFSA